MESKPVARPIGRWSTSLHGLLDTVCLAAANQDNSFSNLERKTERNRERKRESKSYLYSKNKNNKKTKPGRKQWRVTIFLSTTLDNFLLLNYEYEHDPCPFVFGRTPPWALEAGIPEYTYHEKVNQPHSRVRCLGHTRLRTAADLPFIPCQELGEI